MYTFNNEHVDSGLFTLKASVLSIAKDNIQYALYCSTSCLIVFLLTRTWCWTLSQHELGMRQNHTLDIHYSHQGSFRFPINLMFNIGLKLESLEKTQAITRRKKLMNTNLWGHKENLLSHSTRKQNTFLFQFNISVGYHPRRKPSVRSEQCR